MSARRFCEHGETSQILLKSSEFPLGVGGAKAHFLCLKSHYTVASYNTCTRTLTFQNVNVMCQGANFTIAFRK